MIEIHSIEPFLAANTLQLPIGSEKNAALFLANLEHRDIGETENRQIILLDNNIFRDIDLELFFQDFLDGFIKFANNLTSESVGMV